MHPKDFPTHDISTPAALGDAAERWRRAPILAVDTEFVRERTFYPILGLLQISDGRSVDLVDPVALGDLTPLAEILADPGTLKVLHSCGEDLEVLHHAFGDFPRPLFDTQIAAAFAGYGYSLGYAKLILDIYEIELPKGQTRTNWLKRPLTPAQLEYAALDAAFLVPLYQRLAEELERRGRMDWVAEEVGELMDVGRFSPDPRDVWTKIRGFGRLAPRRLAVLRELAAWREEEARRRDLPRNFVIKNDALLDLAQRLPREQSELEGIQDLPPRTRKRFGDKLLELVERGLALPDDALPDAPDRVDLTPYRKTIDRLRNEVKSRAQALDLPPELLATRRTVESVVRRAVTGDADPLPRELRGWRREAVGERLAELAAAGV